MTLIRKSDYLQSVSLELDPQFDMERRVLEHGIWEPHVLVITELLIKEGDICVDVGANIGLHTLAIARKVGGRGKIHAFEPGNQSFSRLAKNVTLNPSLREQIVCEKTCVSDKPGKLKLFMGGDGSNAYARDEFNPSLWNKGGPEDYELCDVTTLDDYLKGARLDFAKIDVEGMEYEVLKGAEKTIRAHKPSIIFETLPSDFGADQVRKAETLMRDHGYLLFGFLLQDDALHPVRYPALHVDTLAIHQSKLEETLDRLSGIVAPFATYKLFDENDPTERTIFELVISTAKDTQILAYPTTEAHLPCLFASGKIDRDNRRFMSIENQFFKAPWHCEFQGTSSEPEEIRGTLTINATSIPLRGRKSIGYRSVFTGS